MNPVSAAWLWIAFALVASNQVAFATAAASYFPPLMPETRYACSPLPQTGCSGLFPVHSIDTKHEASSVALLTNGEAAFSARIALLKSARRSIRMQALIFSGDESGLAIANILKEKKKSGLEVRVIVDAWSNLAGNHIASKLLGWQTQWMYYDLKQHGIEVEGYESLYFHLINELEPGDPLVTNKRFHDKLLVVDAEEPDGAAIVGGMNIANEYFRVGTKPAERWRDQDVLVRGAVVADATNAFDRNYKFFKDVKASRPDLLNTDLAWARWRSLVVKTFGRFKIPFIQNPALKRRVRKLVDSARAPETAPATVRFFQSRPRLAETYIRQAYLQLIAAARDEILIANAYLVLKGEIRSALIDAARRGVRVAVLTNSLETNDLPPLSHVGRYYYKDLIEAGASVYEWDGHRHGDGTLHAKYAVVDRLASVVGSFNLDPRSDLLNSETALVFEDAAVSGELAEQFLKRDLAKSTQISLKRANQFHRPIDIHGKLNLMFSLPLTDWL